MMWKPKDQKAALLAALETSTVRVGDRRLDTSLVKMLTDGLRMLDEPASRPTVMVTLNDVQIAYLNDLTALQLHGTTREEVAYSLVLQGMREAIGGKLIAVRHQGRRPVCK